jgi:hypothetical protein
MLLNHFPIYEIIVDLQKLRVIADRYLASGIGNGPINELESAQLRALLKKVQQECPPLGLTQTSEIADSIDGRPTPESYREFSIELAHLSDLACTRFRGHRVRCFDGTGGVSWSDGSLHGSSSLRLCG